MLIKELLESWQLAAEKKYSLRTFKKYKDSLYRLFDGYMEDEATKIDKGFFTALDSFGGREAKRIAISAYNSLKSYAEDMLDISLPKVPYFMRVKKQRTLPKPLSTQEYKLLINEAWNKFYETEDNFYFAVWILANTGLRVSELLALSRDNFYDEKLIVKGKGEKERVIPLAGEIFATILMHADVFPFKFSYVTFYRRLKEFGNSLGLKELTPHRVRHSYATYLLEQGISVVTIKELLGHSSIETTTIYTKVTGKELDKAAKAFIILQNRLKKGGKNG